MNQISLEELLLPLVEKWWARFCAKYQQYFLDQAIIDFGTCYRFFALHCGLTREQTKDLTKLLEQRGWLKIERHGWRILEVQKREE